MKTCPTCSNSYEDAQYGASFYCKSCMAERGRKYRAENPDKVRATGRKYSAKIPKELKDAWAKAWREKNIDYVRDYRRKSHYANHEKNVAKSREWKDANKDRALAKNAEWHKAHPEANRERAHIRRAALVRAVPAWYGREEARQIMRDCDYISRLTGVKHEVDHIIPIQSKLVCGLHWHGNLRIITKDENRAKKNNFSPDAGVAYARGA